MKFDLATGRAVGAAVPEHFLAGTNWLDGIRKWAMAGVSVLPSLALGFTIDTYLMDGEYAPNFVELASHSRASKAWEPNWDGKSGSEVGWLKEYQVDERRVGIYGPRDEAASTNQIRNPRFENATAGAIGGGGVWPYVSVAGDGGVPYITAGTMTINGVGTESGWSYIEVNLSHPTSSTYVLPLEGVTIPSFVQNDPVCLSAGYKVVSGTITGTVYLITEEHQSGGGYLTEGSVTVAPTSAHTRHYLSRTVANASTASLYAFTSFALTGAHNVTVRIYTPQLEKSATPSSPILPTAGTPAAATRAADVVTGVTTDRASRGWYDTQWDYTSGGVCGDLLEFLPGVSRIGPQGLLVEEQSTNHIRNVRGEGGSAGVFPTHWTPGSNVTMEGTGVKNGWPYVEVSVSGLTSLTTLGFDQYASIAMLNGEDWTVSFGVELVSGTMDNLDINASIRLADSGSSQIANLEDTGGNTDEQIATGQHVRVFHTWTIGDAAAAYGMPRVNLRGFGAGATATLRIYAPQAEKKAHPSSVVLPAAGSPAASTRAADDVYLDTGDWHYAAAHTLMISGSPAISTTTGFTSSTPIIAVLGDADASDYVGLYQSGDAIVPLMRSANSTIAFGSSLGSRAPGEEFRVALAYAPDDMAVSSNTAAQSTDASGTIATPATRLTLGAYGTGGSRWQGFIKSFRYWPYRLSDTELEALVA